VDGNEIADLVDAHRRRTDVVLQLVATLEDVSAGVAPLATWLRRTDEQLGGLAADLRNVSPDAA
jgi:hypothetical protein